MNKLDRKVPIKNILHMFSYIWDRKEAIDNINLDANDDFDSANIMAELFLTNVSDVLKRGLYKEYHEYKEEIRGIRGKIDFKESLNNMSFENAKAYCTFDELEENNKLNQIFKSIAYRLYRCNDLDKANKKKLNNVLLYMNKVDIIELSNKSFDITFNRNNNYCYFLLLICKLIFESTMLSEEKGMYKFINLLDDDTRMNRIFELFVYKFYLKKLNNYNVYYQRKISWNLFGGNYDLIPEMRLDILLENEVEEVIIDTKYYEEMVKSSHYSDKKTLISNNMYQMYTYLNNYQSVKDVRGILLYPYNGNNINEDYKLNIMKNNEIKDSRLSIRTIDLSKNWREVEEDLIDIIKI